MSRRSETEKCYNALGVEIDQGFVKVRGIPTGIVNVGKEGGSRTVGGRRKTETRKWVRPVQDNHLSLEGTVKQRQRK